jgi:hypothetical protein
MTIASGVRLTHLGANGLASGLDSGEDLVDGHEDTARIDDACGGIVLDGGAVGA